MIAILVVLFLGYIGYSLSLPLFPMLFLDPDNLILAGSHTYRAVLFGLLLSTYPLGQFIGAPFLGKLSDKYGRRRVLLTTLLLIIPSHIFTGIAIQYGWITTLFISRLICGLMEGNIVIAQAAMADMSKTAHQKVKNFGKITVASSSAFIFGPIIGGVLASKVSYASAFWGAATLAFLCIFVVLWKFKDIKKPDPSIHIHPLDSFITLYRSLKTKALGPMYRYNSTFYLAVFFFFGFISPYLIDSFHFTVLEIAFTNAYLAIPISLAPLFLKGHFNPLRMMQLARIFFGLALLLFVFLPWTYAMLAILLPCGFFIAVGFTYAPMNISNIAAETRQGEALGVNQSILVFSEAMTGLVGGYLVSLAPSLPLIIGALSSLLLYRIKVRH
ncbi:MAG: Multidrug resistance protein MdtG [Chlamydiia bacterium]|nr:Multidrug resistance protein MdtG [Chlamydiia bacterium]MCH9615489.1 Multidrug resistance protein MdtG [Chlamydiia bacterium]MCH9629144.1 Multidrug resistance protein MdtG [Chlamydiia bacterium]